MIILPRQARDKHRGKLNPKKEALFLTGWSKDGSPNSQVRGKVVAILGQGQNGLIAAKVMRMMGAAQVLGIDPVPERRAVSPQVRTVLR